MKESKKLSRQKISNDLYDYYHGLELGQRFNSNDKTKSEVYQCSQSRKERATQDETSNGSRRKSYHF